MDTFCKEHSGYASRTKRNEEDIQRLFEKFGEAIGLMYKVDKKLENWSGKVAGISLCVSGCIGIIIIVLKAVLEK